MTLQTYAQPFYQSLCSGEEIERIFNVSTAEDYLLKLRANATVEHVRIYRVFLARMRNQGQAWSFNKYFDNSPFKNYISNLSSEDLEKVNHIPAGFVFCNTPNGQITKTEFGNIITISESLQYFLYYMNLANLNFDDIEVPDDVRQTAITIAIRTMLQNEALDFDIDPRGEIPEYIQSTCQYHTDKMIEFIIGHEYSHYLLGHLDEKNLIEYSMLDTSEFKQKKFSYPQQDELAADIDAIERPIFNLMQKEDILIRALFFFVYLDIYQMVKDQISPSIPSARSHPAPMDRFYNLYNHFKNDVPINDEALESLLSWTEQVKTLLNEDVAVNIELYEFYGSIYLGQWRGKPLVDRVDF